MGKGRGNLDVDRRLKRRDRLMTQMGRIGGEERPVLPSRLEGWRM